MEEAVYGKEWIEQRDREAVRAGARAKLEAFEASLTTAEKYALDGLIGEYLRQHETNTRLMAARAAQGAWG
jgi:hypothetical protein